MANAEHVLKLREGVAAWNRWRAANPYITPYLTNADLTGANLTRANLTRADLTGAYLTDANLTGAYLNGANLTNANLNGANLTNAYLNGGYTRNGATWTRPPISIEGFCFHLIEWSIGEVKLGCRVWTLDGLRAHFVANIDVLTPQGERRSVLKMAGVILAQQAALGGVEPTEVEVGKPETAGS